jgi:hypothetical protein
MFAKFRETVLSPHLQGRILGALTVVEVPKELNNVA